MNQDIQNTVKERYGKIATGEVTGCGCGCGAATKASLAVGYSPEELESIPGEANLGVGCGNPLALADVREGQTVLDLGSGAGIDAFLAAERVGSSGRVIGVDMTPEMVERAQRNARQGGYDNVKFRLGMIENLPVESGTVDLVISNCVINLSPEKSKVFAEAFRVLKPGGTLAVSDIVLSNPLPDAIRASVSAYVGCVAGASLREEYLAEIRNAGFATVEIVGETPYASEALLELPDVKQLIDEGGIPTEEARRAASSVSSLKVRAVKA